MIILTGFSCIIISFIDTDKHDYNDHAWHQAVLYVTNIINYNCKDFCTKVTTRDQKLPHFIFVLDVNSLQP